MAVTKIHKGNLSSDFLATPTISLGTAASPGTADTTIRSDATILAFDATDPVASAVGDAADDGAAAVAARRDHRHAREAFATNTVALAAAAAAGAATTLIRSDATIKAFDDSAPPVDQDYSDVAATGDDAFAARRDHVHGMPAAGSLGSTNFVDNEVPTGTVNGVNDSFTLANTPTAGTVKLYKNGMIQTPGAGLDYTISGSTITMLAGNIPQTGDALLASYMK